MTTADLVSITAAYEATMAELKATTLAKGKFSWQMLWTGGAANSTGSTCPSPLVSKDSCAADLRALCSAASPAQSRTMMYAFAPGGCRTDPSKFTQFDADLANFLLSRGDYAYLGHGWLGCSHDYAYPAALDADYGEPAALCAETAPGSQVFRREYSHALVEMDCNTFTPTITMK